MKPRKQTHSGTDDLFRSRLENIIDLRHELVRFGERIEWAFFDEAYEAFYCEEGRPGIPTRMMVGLHILKHMFDLSDEGVCERYTLTNDAVSAIINEAMGYQAVAPRTVSWWCQQGILDCAKFESSEGKSPVAFNPRVGR